MSIHRIKIKYIQLFCIILFILCIFSCKKNEISINADEEKKETEIANEININIVGDIVLSKRLMNIYDKNGIKGIISDKYLEIINEADYNVGNLECTITDDLSEKYEKKYNFYIPEKYAICFKELGINLFTLANNHSMDYGRIGLQKTFENLESVGINYVGAGNDRIEAQKPHIEEIKGHKIAFIGTTEVVPSEDWIAAYNISGLCNTYDGTNLKEIIKKAKKEAEKVIVYIHWGKELESISNNVQKDTAYRLIDYGADLIVGAHPHILQEIEYYKNTPIIYSLGNFIYGMTERETMLLNVSIDYNNNKNGEIKLKMIPGISSYTKVKEYWGGDEYKNFLNSMRSISTTSTISKDGIIQKNEDNYE